MEALDLKEQSHRRFNPLTNEWVLVSPHRTQRPWQGAVEKIPAIARPAYDPTCYLCPGNSRAGGVHNPQYQSTFVFENDFAALKKDTPKAKIDVQGKDLIVAEGESGICRVMCFSPRHDLTLSTMEQSAVEDVVRTWTSQFAELGAIPGISHVQIFENRGEMMGASNPHPHCQIWATESVPNEPAKEINAQRLYLDSERNCLLCDYLKLEILLAERVVLENDSFVVLVPFWAIWPFEVMIISKEHRQSIDEFSDTERTAFADVLRRLTTR